MASEFDPTSATYFAEKSVRDELTRVFDVCVGCRRCTDFCGSFATLFDLVEPHRDAGRLSPSQQDDIIDRCFQCDACVAVCPYTPDQHDLAIDLPKLIVRAAAMRTAVGQRSLRERRTAAILGRPDRVGRVGTRLPSMSNALVGARAGSVKRRVLELATGVTSTRRLPLFAAQRFSHWFRSREGRSREGGSIHGHSRMVIYPTCLVEYGDAEIGRDIVTVSERNGAACVLSEAGCCGAASLHAGDVERFSALATKAVTVLAREIREHGSITVAQAACAGALRRHAVDHVAATARPDAEFVTAHLAERTLVDTAPTTTLVGRSVVHVEQAAGSGAAAGERLMAAGATVETRRIGAGVTSTWGLRASNDGAPVFDGSRDADHIDIADRVVTGEDVLANQAISDQLGARPVHPFQLLARGFDEAVDSGR